MSDECRICSCHGQQSLLCLGAGATLSMTIRLVGEVTNENAPADLHVNYEPEGKQVLVHFDVMRPVDVDGLVGGTFAFNLTDADRLLISLAELHAALRLARYRAGN